MSYTATGKKNKAGQRKKKKRKTSLDYDELGYGVRRKGRKKGRRPNCDKSVSTFPSR